MIIQSYESDQQKALVELRALWAKSVSIAARNYQTRCYCTDPNEPCKHDRYYVEREDLARFKHLLTECS